MRAGRAHDITNRRQATFNDERAMAAIAPAKPSVCSAGGAHHFRIDTPNGPACDGRCKKCGERRTYPTVIADNLGYGDISLTGTKYGVGR